MKDPEESPGDHGNRAQMKTREDNCSVRKGTGQSMDEIHFTSNCKWKRTPLWIILMCTVEFTCPISKLGSILLIFHVFILFTVLFETVGMFSLLMSVLAVFL